MTKLTSSTPHEIYQVVCEIDLLSPMNFRALSFLFLDYHGLAYRHTDFPLDLVLIFQEAKNQLSHYLAQISVYFDYLWPKLQVLVIYLNKSQLLKRDHFLLQMYKTVTKHGMQTFLDTIVY